jgi:hypothetical protein
MLDTVNSGFEIFQREMPDLGALVPGDLFTIPPVSPLVLAESEPAADAGYLEGLVEGKPGHGRRVPGGDVALFDLSRMTGGGENGDKDQDGSHEKTSTGELIGKGSRIGGWGREGSYVRKPYDMSS